MNKVTMIGRITKDIELRFAPGTGMAIAKLNIAVKGFKKDEVDFFQVTAFGKKAETLSQYSKKGDQLFIECSLKNNNYEKDGVKHYDNQLILNSFEFGAKALEKKTNDLTPVVEGDTPF